MIEKCVSSRPHSSQFVSGAMMIIFRFLALVGVIHRFLTTVASARLSQNETISACHALDSSIARRVRKWRPHGR